MVRASSLRFVLLLALLLASCAESFALRADTLDRSAYRVGDRRVDLELALLLINEGSEPLAIRSINYEVVLGSHTVAVGSAAVGRNGEERVEAGQRAEVAIRLAFFRDQLPESILDPIAAGRTVPVLVRGTVSLRLAGRDDLARIPFAAEGRLVAAQP